MKNSIFRTICAVALTVFVSGCKDNEFLDEHPKYFYTIDNVFSNQDQVDQALVNCYNKIRYLHSMGGEGREMFVFRCQNGTDMYDVSPIRKNYQFNDYSNLNPERPEYKYIFGFWYRMISYANLALYGANLDGIEWDSEASRRYIIAQAHFFRAWAYKNLGECFGGVFIVPDLCFEPKFDFERVSRSETYSYAISELECCIDDFPETHPEKIRIVKGAALHTLAALYLDLGIALEEEGRTSEAKDAWEKSVKYASDVIGDGIHSLMTQRFGTRFADGPHFYYASNSRDKTEEHRYEKAGVTIEGNVYWDMFQRGNVAFQDGNKEALWVIHCDLDAYVEQDKGSRLNYSRSFSPTARDAVPGILEGLMEDVGGRGVTWVFPTEYARSLIYEGKWGEGDIRNSDAVFRKTFLGNVKGNSYYGKLIPWSVLYRLGQSESSRINAYTQMFPISCKVASDVYPDDDFGGNKSYLYRDDYVIRLAETYLIRAEAYMRVGDNANAAKDINVVRSRAQCKYLVSEADINLDLILDERARELIYEEYRWNTLLRMGGTVAVDRIRQYAYWDYPRSGSMKNFSVWPIPQSVIDTNKDVKIDQNEGW
ncbi:MAG: RagB/SusD family nutrient uptake outer membrane protein [Bacteroidales bacterium]|nr:RagB/SusD family nutrient uptake outer membrane protein [Bacteroidales bacterium]